MVIEEQTKPTMDLERAYSQPAEGPVDAGDCSQRSIAVQPLHDLHEHLIGEKVHPALFCADYSWAFHPSPSKSCLWLAFHRFAVDGSYPTVWDRCKRVSRASHENNTCATICR